MSQSSVKTDTFYNTYYGHTIYDLTIIRNCFKKRNCDQRFIYLAGDSSLDNKYWLDPRSFKNAVNGYENILRPSIMKPDICYHLNKLIPHNQNISCINCAVEESTIRLRENSLLPQDKFIRDNIGPNDILIVSVGGNDIALSPSLSTIWNMILLTYLNDIDTIKKGPDHAWGMNHFIHMFRDKVRDYILKLISKTKPSKIIICMIYYPDETMTGSWADRTLGYLGYNTNPEKLQEAIRQMFIRGTSNIYINGVEIIPFPMFDYLNGKDSNHYIVRVEPSESGGRVLACALKSKIFS